MSHTVIGTAGSEEKLQLIREHRRVGNERVVAGDCEGRGEAGEDPLPFVAHRSGFAVWH